MDEKIVMELEEEDTQKDKYLTFSLEDELYGIEIKYVIEIVGMHPITRVPELPDYVKGIINLRGKIIPVVDARAKFRKAEKEYNDRTCIIIVEMKSLSVGLIVDAVSEVAKILAENLEEPPNLNKNAKRYIRYIGKNSDKVVMILDCDRLLEEEDETSISNLKA